MTRLIEEIRKGSFWTVLGIYLAASLVILRIIAALGNNFVLPSWVFIAALVLLSTGLPIVLSTAFVQGVSSAIHEVRGEAASVGRAGEAAAIRRVFSWRNALVGGVGGFLALGLGVAAWILAGAGEARPRLDALTAEAAEPPRSEAGAEPAETAETAAEVGAANAFRALALAIASLDIEATLAAYDDDPGFTYAFGSDLIKGRESFDARVKAGFAALRDIEIWEIDDLKATRLDDEHVMVVVRFHEVATDTAGTRLSVAGVFTNVFVRRGDAWRVAFGHTSAEADAVPD